MVETAQQKNNSKATKSLFAETVDFFTSVRTTVWLLILIAIASILGTVFPQDVSLAQLQATSSSFVFRLIVVLDLNNVFGSWWFLLLLILLSINLVACLLQRVPNILSEWDISSTKKSFRFVGNDSRSETELKSILNQSFSSLLGVKPLNDAADNPATLSWIKHRCQLLGFPFIHIGIIVILIGALVGLIYGYRGHITIPEGEKEQRFVLMESGQETALPFEVAVDEFTFDRYPTGQPKEFRSDVRILENGKEALKGSIRVNHPLTYRSIHLYQSGYRALDIKSVELQVIAPEKKTENLQFRRSANTPVPGTDYTIVGAKVDPGGTKRGAGAELIVEDKNKKRSNITVYETDTEPAALGDRKVKFKGYRTRYATILQVGYDPGTYGVWAGSTMLMVGLFLTLFTNHRRISVMIRSEENRRIVEVSGGAKKLRREFRESVERTFKDTMRGTKS
jgi:cytochrome c biogenesis protein